MTVEDIERALLAPPPDPVVEEWGDRTRTRVIHGVLSALRDFGVSRGEAIKHIASASVSFAGFVYVLGRLRAQLPSIASDHLAVRLALVAARGPAGPWASPRGGPRGASAVRRCRIDGAYRLASRRLGGDGPCRCLIPSRRSRTRSSTRRSAPSRQPSIFALRLRARGGAGGPPGHDRPERLPHRQWRRRRGDLPCRPVLGCGGRVGLLRRRSSRPRRTILATLGRSSRCTSRCTRS